MGSVSRRVASGGERRETLSWRGKVTGPDGRQRSRSFARKVDAERWVTEQEAAIDRGEWIDPRFGRESVGELWSRWLERAERLERLQPSTLGKYRRTWRLYLEPHVGPVRLASLTRLNVQDVVAIAERDGSAWQAMEALKLIRLLLNYAVDEGRVGRNVAARVKAPETTRTKPRVLTPTELTALVDRLPERYRALVLLDAYGSLRWSEVVALRREDLDLEARTVRVCRKLVEVDGEWVWGEPKTKGSARVVDLPEVIIKPLAEHLLRFPPLRDQSDPEREGLIFYGERGGPVRRHAFGSVWRKASAEVGLGGVRVEWLRHSGASLAYLATRDLKAVAARLGHTSVRMADEVYVGLYDETGRQVAQAIDALAQSWPNGPASSALVSRDGS
jgi:integrase